MKHLALIAALMAPLPAAAQQAEPDAMGEGVDLLQRGMRSLFEGFLSEMQPAITEMGEAWAEMRPMAEQLLRLVDDIGNYETPVILENGDILIRRKPKPPEPLKEGEVEL